jgi:hypothetical protein
MTDQITAELRVKSCVVSDFPKPNKRSFAPGKEFTEEAWEIKAEGTWGETTLYPVSLHFTTPPGHPVLPSIGKIKITIEAV